MQQALRQVGIAFRKIIQTIVGIAEVTQYRYYEPNTENNIENEGLEPLNA